MDTKEYDQLKRNLANAQDQASQSTGAFNQAMSQLKELDPRATDMESAEKLLADMNRELDEANAEAARNLESFLKKYEGKL